jgi:hypothetical protein
MRDSLVAGKMQGNIADSGRALRKISAKINRLSTEFPTGKTGK